MLIRKNLVDSTEIAINQTENGEYFQIEGFNSVPHSNDGRFVLFVSNSSKLIKDYDGDANTPHNLFIKDLDTGEIKQIAEEFYGGYQISGDGKSIVYSHNQKITHKNLETGVTEIFDGYFDQHSNTNNISFDGSVVLFTNNQK